MRVTAALNLSRNAISCSKKTATSIEWRQLRTIVLLLGEVTIPEAINHLSRAQTSERSSVGPSGRTGFVFNRSRIGLFATKRNPSIHSLASREAMRISPLYKAVENNYNTDNAYFTAVT